MVLEMKRSFLNVMMPFGWKLLLKVVALMMVEALKRRMRNFLLIRVGNQSMINLSNTMMVCQHACLMREMVQIQLHAHFSIVETCLYMVSRR